MATKEVRRRYLLSIRRDMPAESAKLLSDQICRLLAPVIAGLQLRSLHYFEPIVASREIDISPLIREVHDIDGTVLLAVSRRRGNGWMDVMPDGTPAPESEQYGCVIVPMLGFNQSLHRIGYGGGHYDRFLQSQSGAVKIGVCYENGRVEFVHEAHDVPMDIIVTEKAVYRQVSTS